MGSLAYDASQNALAALLRILQGETDAPGWPLNSSSNALENSRTIKSGAGILYGFQVLNTLAAAQFIQLFDSQALPADGAVPVCVFTVPTNPANLSVFWGVGAGRFFQQGIVMCNSTTAATKTIGAANCFFDAQYI
jgi:hypothetical protein